MDDSTSNLNSDEDIIEDSFEGEDDLYESIIHTGVRKQPVVIESDDTENEDRLNDISTNISSNVLDDDGQKKNSKIEVDESDEDSLHTIDYKSDAAENDTFQNSFHPTINSTNIMTPRQSKPIIESPSPSNVSQDVIAISSDEEMVSVIGTPRRGLLQTTIYDHFPKKKPTPKNSLDIQSDAASNRNNVPVPGNQSHVTQEDIDIQKDIVRNLKAELLKSKNVLLTLNIEGLPDKGEQLRKHYEHLTKTCALEEETLSKMIARASTDNPATATTISPVQKRQSFNWADLEAEVANVQPKTFGKQALATHNQQKFLTVEALQQIHGSLSTRPEEHQMATDPKGLRVELMPHQKHALAWLMWREGQKPSGGILADDMGLGKTLTMISLMLKVKEEQDDSDDEEKENASRRRKNGKYNGGTLVVCPASLLNQWSGEVQKRVKKNLVSLEVYHGPKRETKARRLSKYDMVVTTYSIVQNENEKDTPLFNIKWRRIVLDEAHQIRNYKCLTSISVCNLSAKSRWALTGTPVHNKELDLYGLLKFLRCSPFDDLSVWKKWVANKQDGGQDRLNTVIQSLLLRRTKAQLMEKGTLQCLPERNWELVEVSLNKQETMVYQKVLIFSRDLFAKFLYQRAQKNQEMCDDVYRKDPNSEYYKMHRRLVKMNKVKEVKAHEILLLLLRLRQICCHLSLITKMLENGEQLDEVDDHDQDKHVEEFNLLDQLNKLNLNDEEEGALNESITGISVDTKIGLAEATRGILNPSNPIFAETVMSSKVKAVLDTLKDKVLSGEDKAIVVSQWTSFLKIIGENLKKEGIPYQQLDGRVPVNKRMMMVDEFNNPRHSTKVLLLSLTAGGVGLNLVGANHLFLVDLHWNPQLEMQAQDRIYRVGQTKMVNLYKFMTVDTIEQQIRDLQLKKLKLADNMLTGAKIQAAKLSLDDLKMLFNMP